MIELPNASMQFPWDAPAPSSTRLLPLNPALMMTCEPRGIVGAVGVTAACCPG